MSFTDKDKRILIEVVNHIHNAYVSDQAFKESENSITLPARLVRLSADAIGQTYRPGILGDLDKSDRELLLHSLVKAVAAMKISLQEVVDALTDQLPSELRNKLGTQLEELESMKIESESAMPARALLEPGIEIPPDKHEADELRERHESLLAAKETLNQVDLEELRDEVFQLEAEVEPLRSQMEELQRSVSEKTSELERLTTAIADAKQTLTTHDNNAKQQLENIVGIAGELVTAVDPYLAGCESRIREAVEKVAERVSEGRRLKGELQGRITEVSEVLAETARIAAVLRLYTDADRRVALSVPAVINVTKEKLSRVEDQLQEIDSDLKDALAQHQSAKHIAEVAGV